MYWIFPGDLVKFRDSLWKIKKELGMRGGLFGKPLTENSKNEFRVVSTNIIDEDSVELLLDGYPWMVYAEELEYIPLCERKC